MSRHTVPLAASEVLFADIYTYIYIYTLEHDNDNIIMTLAIRILMVFLVGYLTTDLLFILIFYIVILLKVY